MRLIEIIFYVLVIFTNMLWFVSKVDGPLHLRVIWKLTAMFLIAYSFIKLIMAILSQRNELT